METVHRTENKVRAVMLEGVLRDASIPVLLQRVAVSGLPEIAYGALQSEYELIVPGARADEARHLIDEYLASLSEEAAP